MPALRSSGSPITKLALLAMTVASLAAMAPVAHPVSAATPAPPAITPYPTIMCDQSSSLQCQVGPVTYGPDGNVWMASPISSFMAGGWIVRISPDGDQTTFPIPTDTVAGYPTDITTGSDGNLWFTLSPFQEVGGGGSPGNGLGRITPTGEVSTFPFAEITGPVAITTGPDGNLWWIESAAVCGTDPCPPSDDVASVATASPLSPTEVTRYTLPQPPLPDRLTPQDITTGPDGNLWITSAGSTRFLRVTTEGAIDPFSGAPASWPTSIVAGPDGALWFTDRGSNSIGRLAVDGTVTSCSPFGDDISFPADLAVGSDGALWVVTGGSETVTAQLVRVDTSCAAHAYALSGAGTGGGFGNITAAAPGSLWYSFVADDPASADPTVGRIDLPPAPLQPDSPAPVPTTTQPTSAAQPIVASPAYTG